MRGNRWHKAQQALPATSAATVKEHKESLIETANYGINYSKFTATPLDVGNLIIIY
jgi:hypothetical protein